jgi:hypothetical protein
MQVWRLLYIKLVGPRGEKLESTGPFWSFSYSHLSGKSTCHFQGNYDLVGDAVREVVWALFTYGGCNKGGSSVVGLEWSILSLMHSYFIVQVIIVAISQVSKRAFNVFIG